MSPDDLAVMIFLGFVGFGLYAGLKRVAEAIEAFGRKTINVSFGEVNVIHHHEAE